jgi:hypothetical protein
LRHYALSLRRRFCNVRGALGGVERSVVNYVISIYLLLPKYLFNVNVLIVLNIIVLVIGRTLSFSLSRFIF